MYIGRIHGAGALALTGVGLCFPIITLITAFSMLFGTTGGSALFSMQRGKGDEEAASKILGTTFTMLLLTGVVVAICGLIFFKPLLYFFGASDSTYAYAKEYGTIYLLGSPFILVALGMNPFINAQGYGRIGMFTVAIGALLNTVLDPIFIFVFRMGIRGAAIATVISQIVSCLCVVGFLMGKKRSVPLKTAYMPVDFHWLGRIVTLGFSGFIMGCTTSLVQVVCNKTAFAYGGDLYVGVMTILNSVREIFSVPLTGVTQGGVSVIAFSYGAHNYRRVRQGVSFITRAAIVVSLLTWALIFFAPGFFVKIFNHDPHLLAAGAAALKIYFFGYFMMALQNAGQNTFLALGKSKQAIFFSLFRKVIIVVPLTLLLPHLIHPGINGVFWAEPVSNVIGGGCCFLTMRYFLNKEIGKETTEVPSPHHV